MGSGDVNGCGSSRAPTTLADARLAGLERGVRYLFRYRALTKAGMGDWSDPVSLLVI